MTRFRAIRASGKPHLSVPQRKFEMSTLPADSSYAGKVGARVVVNLDLSDIAGQDFALYGIEPSGEISSVIPNRAALAAMLVPGSPITTLGAEHYRLQVDADHSGWSGFVLLAGRGGFSDKLVVAKAGRPSRGLGATVCAGSGGRRVEGRNGVVQDGRRGAELRAGVTAGSGGGYQPSFAKRV